MNLSKDLQDRLDNILLLMKEKQAPIKKKKKKNAKTNRTYSKKSFK